MSVGSATPGYVYLVLQRGKSWAGNEGKRQVIEMWERDPRPVLGWRAVRPLTSEDLPSRPEGPVAEVGPRDEVEARAGDAGAEGLATPD